MTERIPNLTMPRLAHLNIARMKVAWDDPEFRDFREALDPVNESAEASPGFVWRLVSAEDDSPAMVAFENEGWLVNLTVWESVESLQAFVRSPGHLAIMRRRAEWFTPIEVRVVLWWIDDDQTPSFEEAMRRLECLKTKGPTQAAFDFRTPFPPLQGAQAPCYSPQPAVAEARGEQT